MASLVSSQTRLEAPFIIATIGNYTFGHTSVKEKKTDLGRLFNITYPNFMEALNIVKVNGAVNMYTLKMVYGITQFDDPNLLEKVFSSVSKTRKIKLTYGDWNAPTYRFTNEEAIITKITSNVDFNSSRITYNLTCTSTALSTTVGVFNFPAVTRKPSSVLIDLLKDKRYGLSDIFKGMKDINKVQSKGLIPTNDKSVKLEKKTAISIFDYISYLVSSMVASDDTDTKIKSSCYFWATYDDAENMLGGPYFRVQQVRADSKYNLSYNTYEVDVGYPSGNFVTSFSTKSDETWSLLYNYAESIDMPQHSYTIDKDGKVVSNDTTNIMMSSKYLKTTQQLRSWWSQMTQFPITATLTVKGLLRPAILMSYVKINCYFYGHKHISSGLYIITKQEDIINSDGYKTTLSLTRVSGDENIYG